MGIHTKDLFFINLLIFSMERIYTKMFILNFINYLN